MIGPVQYAANMPVYLPQPVNRRHPLNQGLVAWWKVLPAWSAGNKWLDLMGLNPGTLTNMGAGSGWGGSPAPGGYGSLLWNITGQYIDTNAAVANWNWNSPFTWACWIFNNNGATSNRQIMAGTLNSGATVGWFVDLFSSNTSDFRFKMTSLVGSMDRTTTANALVIGWNRVIVTGDGTGTLAGLKYYINGQPNTTSVLPVDTLGTSDPRTGLNYRLGQSGAFTTITGKSGLRVDSNKIYSRALSPAEVAWDYRDEVTGNRQTLNRYGFDFPSTPIVGTVSYPYMGVASRV